jgi:hypothetical protein
MTQHCPSKADFTAEGVATVSGSCPSAKTTALKSGIRIRSILDSDPDTQQLYFDAPMQNSNADAYRTVWNADPDADAGSVVRCCAVPHLTPVPVRGGTRGSGPGSASQSSNRVLHLF